MVSLEENKKVQYQSPGRWWIMKIYGCTGEPSVLDQGENQKNHFLPCTI